MTLGQANFLTVVSYLIQNAVLRAQRYMQALEEQRYSGHSRILEPEAFESLVQAYMNAELKNLVECVLVKVDVGKERYREIDEHMSRQMRDSDLSGNDAGWKTVYSADQHYQRKCSDRSGAIREKRI